jgi:hypothetical protein
MVNYPQNFRHVVESIYAGGAITPEQIPLLQSLGINFVLSLDATMGDKIAPALEVAKIQQIYIPLEPTSALSDNLKYLLRNLTNIMQKQPLYIHCLHGSDRTGLVIAAYRVLKYNWKPEQAINEAKRWGYGLGISGQTQQQWQKILSVLYVSKNPNDIGSIDDGQIITDLKDFHGINREMVGFPGSLYSSNIPGTIPTTYPYQATTPIEDRIELLKSYLGNDTPPLVGYYNNTAPPGIRGAGPFTGVQDWDLQQDTTR